MVSVKLPAYGALPDRSHMDSSHMNAPLPAKDGIRIAVIGLGYVGLPLAVAFGRVVPTLGFDIDSKRVAELRGHHDHTLEASEDELRAAKDLTFADDAASLAGCNVFIVTVPTPIDEYKRPDLRPLEAASRTVGRAIARGGVAIYESSASPASSSTRTSAPATAPSASIPATRNIGWRRS